MAHSGINGRILRVDLSRGATSVETLPEAFYRKYFGGEGLVGYFLLNEVPPGVEPLGAENKLVFATGPLTGLPVGGCGRHSVGARSPLTGAFGEAEAGGYWGAELKMSGFDAVIVEGKADSPTYLVIQDGEVTLKDARHLWGMKTKECQQAIREELGDSQVKVAQIGPGGESLVRFAGIANDLDAFAGRCGLGAVMGSKNLKAIACRGHQWVPMADAQVISEIGKWVRDNAPVNNSTMRDFGTASVVRPLNASGGLPTLNFRAGSFEQAEAISGEAMSETILVRRRSCFACPIQCKREVKLDTPYEVDPDYGGPEYETIAAIGSNCGIGDLKAISKGNELLNAYGLDSIAGGMAISFAMECFERGLLTTEDTGGIELRFGDAAVMLEMIELIARRKGIGDLLAEGTARAAKKIGRGAEDCLLTIKGQEMSMHEPRWKQGMGVGYAMSPTGADHCHNMHDSALAAPGRVLDLLAPLGILEALPVDDLSPAKMRMLTYYTHWMHFLNSAVCCYFVNIYGGVGLERTVDLVRASTGWDVSLFELMKVGERSLNMARVFNAREGFTSDDDRLPERFSTPHTAGPLAGTAVDRTAFRQAKEAYYGMMGWQNGVPTPAKLGELGIEWAAPHL